MMTIHPHAGVDSVRFVPLDARARDSLKHRAHAHTYDGFGALATYSASYKGNAVYSSSVTSRDVDLPAIEIFLSVSLSRYAR